jgi:hypothetical protein
MEGQQEHRFCRFGAARRFIRKVKSVASSGIASIVTELAVLVNSWSPAASLHFLGCKVAVMKKPGPPKKGSAEKWSPIRSAASHHDDAGQISILGAGCSPT